ncbi:hypothetical protein GPECTOR_12g541 [Gonium pectorale]|uniref:Protein kinase domain-containing protein n=1 Tax=Gonium pectorale TaxID=33097 RepID=A0A150GPB3_GONPE|nr:hypothetical protein GPECTOR_12g541 [Gonium pectorale]|eukprot:KXZ51578.1 hypothetical protein GPECTOR_12g541 [Gonium pectorale]
MDVPATEIACQDVTLQGMAANSLGRRSRRASFIMSLGFGAAADGAHTDADGDGSEHAVLKSSASVGGASRRRRASIISILRPSQRGLEGADSSMEGVSASGPSLSPSKASLGRPKSRRASVMDFFRFSGTGLRSSGTGLADDPAGAATSRRSSRAFRTEGGFSAGRSGRRRSVIDILGHSSKKSAAGPRRCAYVRHLTRVAGGGLAALGVAGGGLEALGVAGGGLEALGVAGGGLAALGVAGGGLEALGVAGGGLEALGVAGGGLEALGVAGGGLEALGVFAKLMNQEYDDAFDNEEDDEDGRLWFTSLNDFKPLTFKYLTGRYSSAYFACSVKTGQHYILKQFEKDKMSTGDERGVRRALAFAQMLEHEHIMQCCGTWEDESALYIVEEYAIKGDLLQDSMSHPEKYTESFMATKVVKPLLEVLVYLHGLNVVHRAIFPEYVMFGHEDRLKLGHFTSAVDQRLDPPTERIPFLDYMAPEMLSVRQDDEGAGFGLPVAAAGRSGRGLSTHSTRVIRMQGPSNDGSTAFATQFSTGSQALLGGGGGGNPSAAAIAAANAANSSYHGGRPAGLLTRSASKLRRAMSVSGAQVSSPEPGSPVSRGASRLNLRGPLSILNKSSRRLSPLQAQPSDGEDVRAFSRSGSQFGGPGGSSPSRRLSAFGGIGSGAPSRQASRPEMPDAPWLRPREHELSHPQTGIGGPSPIRRRKSQLEEMSAPWLRPLDSSNADDGSQPVSVADVLMPPSPRARVGGEGFGGDSGVPGGASASTSPDVVVADALPALPPALSTRPAAAAARLATEALSEGTPSNTDPVFAATSLGLDSEASRRVLAIGIYDGVGESRTSFVGAVRSEDGVGESLTGMVAAGMVEQTRLQSLDGTGRDTPEDALRAAGHDSRPPSAGQGRHEPEGAPASRRSSSQSADAPGAAPRCERSRQLEPFASQRQRSAIDAPPPPLLPTTQSQPPPLMSSRPLSSFRRVGSIRRPGSAIRPGSASRNGPLPAPAPPPQEDAGDSGSDPHQSLPGYAGDLPPPPAAHTLPTSTRPISSLNPAGPESAFARVQSARHVGSRLGNTSRRGSALIINGPCLPGPGPVAESMQRDEDAPYAPSPAHTPGASHGVGLLSPRSPRADGDAGEAGMGYTKQARTGVSFTDSPAGTTPGGGGGAESLPDLMTEDVSVRPSRLLPRLSRQLSTATGGTGTGTGGAGTPTAGNSTGQVVISGIRTLARTFTARLGKSMGRSNEGLSNPSLDELGNESGGMGPASLGQVPTPRQSVGGGGGGGGASGAGLGGGGPAEAMSIFVPTNPWEWQDHYDEKVDLWQVGCLTHEILCMSLPFETDDKVLACALILWADIVSFPDHLSPECHAFMRACLTKNPAERPSAAELLQHPWITRHAAGEVLKSVRQQREEDGLVALPNGQQLTLVQRAAAAVGLGWLVGVPAADSGAAGAGAASAGSGWGAFSWLRQWTAKVLPLGGGSAGNEGSKEGEANFERAIQMVQEQVRKSMEAEAAAGGGSRTAAGKRNSIEQPGSKRSSVDAHGAARARHSVDSASRRHSTETARARYSMESLRGGQVDASTRWQAVL